jgi:hypothetical protein
MNCSGKLSNESISLKSKNASPRVKPESNGCGAYVFGSTEMGVDTGFSSVGFGEEETGLAASFAFGVQAVNANTKTTNSTIIFFICITIFS